MKKLTALFFSVLFSVVAWSAPANEGTHVVALFENQSPEVVARFHGVGRIRTWHRFLNGRWGALSGFSCSPNANQLARLVQDTRVYVVESNVTVTALSQTLPTGVRRIGCTNNAIWLATTTTPINADVAVIDTGIDLTHPDLNVWQNVSFTGTATGNDDNGHGTHCAGIIGAQNNGIGVVGVAPGVRLWAVKVLHSTGSGSLSQIISGVDYVTGHAADIEVASMSLGGLGLSDSLRLAIQNSVARGVVYVVAAGNSHYEVYGGDFTLGTSDDTFPACYPEVMTVSAIADSDGLTGGVGASTPYGTDDSMATFSNFAVVVDPSKAALGVRSPGLAIDVAAPGVNIYSTYTNGGYATLSGTSMACPHVAGAVAIYISANGRATDAAGVAAIRQAFINAGSAPTTWGNPAWNAQNALFDFYPEPLVQVAWITGGGPPPPPPNYPPSVSITQPTATSIAQGTIVTVTASASDAEDGDLSSSTSISDSVAGVLGSGPSRTYTPAVGAHTITAQVTDSGGLSASTTKTFSVTATNAPALPLTVTVTTDKANYSNKMKALITVTVRSSGVAVSGATVTVNVRGASGKTSTKTGLTTSAAGTASYYFNINRGQLGAGTATVSANASKTGYVAGTGSTTFTVN